MINSCKKCIYNNLVLLIVLVVDSPETKKKLKSSCRQEIQILFTKMSCFQHNMAYGKSNDLAKRTQSDKVLRDKAFKIASCS